MKQPKHKINRLYSKNNEKKNAELLTIDQQRSKIVEIMKDFDYLQNFITKTGELKNTQLQQLINKGRKITEDLQVCFGTHFKVFYFNESFKSEQNEGMRPIQVSKHSQNFII